MRAKRRRSKPTRPCAPCRRCGSGGRFSEKFPACGWTAPIRPTYCPDGRYSRRVTRAKGTAFGAMRTTGSTDPSAVPARLRHFRLHFPHDMRVAASFCRSSRLACAVAYVAQGGCRQVAGPGTPLLQAHGPRSRRGNWRHDRCGRAAARDRCRPGPRDGCRRRTGRARPAAPRFQAAGRGARAAGACRLRPVRRGLADGMQAVHATGNPTFEKRSDKR